MNESNYANNGTTNSSSNSTSSAAVDEWMILLSFVQRLSENPVAALTSEFPGVVALLLSFTLLPLLLRKLMAWTVDKQISALQHKSAASTPISLHDAAYDLQAAKAFMANKDSTTTHALWFIGVSQKCVSVSEDGVLRAAIMTRSVPTPTDILDTLVKAAHHPADSEYKRRPKFAVFLDTAMCPATTMQRVMDEAAKAEWGGIKVLKSMADLSESELNEIKGKRETEKKVTGEAAKQIQMMQQQQRAMAAGQPKPDYVAQPSRMCFVCRKQIENGAKPSQCSACKAIIYCGPDCAKKDWPSHKTMCAGFKQYMLNADAKKLHDFPFTYYTPTKPLSSYNQVIHLVKTDLHNVGLYRRLCHCYEKVACGELSGESDSLLSQLPSDNLDQQGELLGVPAEFMPLNKIGFTAGKDVKEIRGKVLSWKQYYERVGLPLDSPLAMVLEYPLSIFHFLNTVFIPKGDFPKKFVLHLLGVERELDLMHLYQVLLPLLPGMTNLEIHMIGTAASPRLAPHHRHYTFHSADDAKSTTLNIHVHTGTYDENHLAGKFGADAVGVDTAHPEKHKPDGVIILNAAVMNFQTWVPTMKMLVAAKIKTVITEPMEPACEVIRRNFEAIGAVFTTPITTNPFRQPVLRFSPENNFPAFSNGFYFGINT